MEFYVKTRDENGNPLTLQGACKTCQRIEGRIRQGIIRRGRPYEPWKPSQTPEERRARKRERYANETPKQREDRREYWRIYAEVQRRRKGIPPRQFRNRRPSVVDKTVGPVVPPAPLQEWLTSVIPAIGISQQQLAQRAHMDEKQVRRLLTTEDPIRLSHVDRVVVAVSPLLDSGPPAILSSLYPLD